MDSLFSTFRRTHLFMFLGFYLVFASFTYLILNSGSVSDRSQNAITAATLGTLLGPFTGSIARHNQSCCWQVSVSLFPYCLLALGIAAVIQLVPLPLPHNLATHFRLAVWGLGLLCWFAGTVLSLAHAVS